MQDFLIQLSGAHVLWAYFTIIVVAILEGPILSVILGIILRLGYFAATPIFIVLMIGDLLGDMIWYGIGRRWGLGFVKRFGKYVNVTENSIEKMKELFHRHSGRILFISKVSNGFGFALAVLMTAGMTHIPFKKYMAVNLLGQIVWTGVLIGTGYFFGHLYSMVDSALGYVSITALAVVILFAFFGYRNYLKQRAKELNL